jgi:hypothetical protein
MAAASKPAPSPCTGDEGLGIVESERLAVAHDLLPADEHMPYCPLAGGIDETADPEAYAFLVPAEMSREGHLETQ